MLLPPKRTAPAEVPPTSQLEHAAAADAMRSQLHVPERRRYPSMSGGRAATHDPAESAILLDFVIRRKRRSAPNAPNSEREALPSDERE
jgi:hypothetical protein